MRVIRGAYWLAAAALMSGTAVADDLPEWVAGQAQGPYPLTVFEVVGAGVVVGRAQIGRMALVSLWRLRGIDAPRLRPDAGCVHEHDLAEVAVITLRAMLNRQTVWITDLAPSPEPKQLAGRIRLADGQDVGALLVEYGLAKPAGTARHDPWCGW